LLGFVIVIGGLSVISYLTTQYDPQSCEDVIKHERESLEAACSDMYLELGSDSPEECVNDQMAMFDHRRACNMLNKP